MVLHKYDDECDVGEGPNYTYYIKSLEYNIENLQCKYSDIYNFIIESDLHNTHKNYCLVSVENRCDNVYPYINLNKWQYMYSYLDMNEKTTDVFISLSNFYNSIMLCSDFIIIVPLSDNFSLINKIQKQDSLEIYQDESIRDLIYTFDSLLDESNLSLLSSC
jgi:hypothetical protein